MGARTSLHELLTEITEHVYFQPPPNLQMEYPCIVYRREDATVQHAGNSPYVNTQRYLLTVIDQSPDSEIVQAVRALPLCRYRRNYATAGLNHDVFALYF